MVSTYAVLQLVEVVSASGETEQRYLEERVEGLDGREGAENIRSHDTHQLC